MAAVAISVFSLGIALGISIGKPPASPAKQAMKPAMAALVEKPSAPAIRLPTKMVRQSNTELQKPKTPANLPAAPAPAPVPDTWLANAVSIPETGGRPMISVILDDLGLDRRRTERTVRLSGPLTLAYLPYAKDLEQQTRAARALGHELLVHIPMQPGGDADPGPNALLTSLQAEETRFRLDWSLSQFSNYIGINNHMGSRFTADETAMRLVMQEARRRGLAFVDSLTTAHSQARRIGDDLGVPTVARDVFLDDTDSEDEVWLRLTQAERIALRHGSAIAIGHPRDHTLNVLEDWLRTIEDRGFVVVPVSAVIQARLAKRSAKLAGKQ